jgi:hypothetical protein
VSTLRQEVGGKEADPNNAGAMAGQQHCNCARICRSLRTFLCHCMLECALN